ncbi:MAG TPA: hypothetical protein VIX13_02360 [Candidatus Eisenbacteria bacterium]
MTQFDAARRAALMGDLLRIVLGRPRDLLPFDEVRERLHLRRFVERDVQEVPLDRVVGTVGREHDFNRAFLPRRESLRDRWRKMTELAEGPEGFPPVELYQVGDSYFVVDGHHRVSVARSMGLTTIEARVKEFLAPVPLSPDEALRDVILKCGRADFLEATGLKQTEPEEYRVASVNGYERLLEHVNGHRYFLGIERNAPVPWGEAVRSWRDTVYRPMIETIRRSGALEEFPGLTETDLYLFTMDHLHHLRQRYHDRTIGPEQAVRTVPHERRALQRVLRSARSWWERSVLRR